MEFKGWHDNKAMIDSKKILLAAEIGGEKVSLVRKLGDIWTLSVNGQVIAEGYWGVCNKELMRAYGHLLTYNGVVPLIARQDEKVKWKMWKLLMVHYTEEFCWVEATPRELLEALFIATGKLNRKYITKEKR